MSIERAFRIGLLLLLLGLVSNFAETWYFGWNMSPGSTAELYADVATGIPFWFGIMLLGRVLLTVKLIPAKKQQPPVVCKHEDTILLESWCGPWENCLACGAYFRQGSDE